jgi:hypothetical protein
VSFWRIWSRKPPAAEAPVSATLKRSFTESDRAYTLSALDRFDAVGLHIRPDLNRELIVVRALIDIERWRPDDRDLGEQDLQSLFLALAAETDSLTWYVDDVQELFPDLASMDDDTAEVLLQDQSRSIFANAASICTVNEDNSLDNMVLGFCELAGIAATQVNRRVMKDGLTHVSFEVGGLGDCRFTIESRKRPDITPLLAEMNRVTKIKGIGQFITVPEGSSESDTFIFATESALPGIIEFLGLDPRAALRL